MSQTTPAEANDDGEPPIAPGTIVGEYEIGGLLGVGGFGSVYRAVHPLIGKSAAVKILKQEFSAKPEMVARFVSEARSVNQIRHRNIIDIFSFGRLDDGRQYFVMELLEGVPLDKYLDAHGKLTLNQAVPVLRQLARALGAAHAAGITHRDIKPENVFLTFDDDRLPVPKLLDFGIAKLVVDKLSQHKTRSGVPMGTPLYMSPEQVHGRDVDPRSDIYSFGVMTFQLLTGRTPFTGETMMSVMMQQIGAAPPAPSSVEPSLPPEVDAPILHMLEKEPEKRPATIQAAVDALLEAAARAGVEGVTSATPSSLEPLPKPWSATRLIAQTPAKPPSEATIAALGASDTLVASEAPRHETGTGASGTSRARVPLFVGIAVALGALCAIAFVALRREAPTVASAAPPAFTTTVAVSQPAISTVVSPAVSATAVVATSVKLLIKTNPSDAEVWIGKVRMGRAGDELSIPRGTEEIVLTIKKPGYVAQTMKIVPSGDIAEAVILTPQPKAQSEYGTF